MTGALLPLLLVPLLAACQGARLLPACLAGHWTFRLGGMVSAMITARYAALEVCKAANQGA